MVNCRDGDKQQRQDGELTSNPIESVLGLASDIASDVDDAAKQPPSMGRGGQDRVGQTSDQSSGCNDRPEFKGVLRGKGKHV